MLSELCFVVGVGWFVGSDGVVVAEGGLDVELSRAEPNQNKQIPGIKQNTKTKPTQKETKQI